MKIKAIFAAVLFCAAAFKTSIAQNTGPISPAKSEIVAIDVLLEPDATMLKHARASNVRLLGVFPKGFAFDATHTPHITMLMAFVRKADLKKVYAAEEKVFAAVNMHEIKLEAFKYYYAPAGSAAGLAGICAKPTEQLMKLQADIIAAAKPFMLNTGTIGAFTAGHDDPSLDAGLIEFVSAFEQKATGAKFNPHVSTGLAPREYLDKLLAEPFEPFTFSSARAAVFQLGPYGAATKKLKEWKFKR